MNSPDESRAPRIAPAVMLVLISPIIAEVLFGSTRMSAIFVLPPEIGVWGCGALLIREIAVRKRLTWIGVLLLGMALAIAEEWIIQQTSLAPMAGVLAKVEYGRAWGVNWVYFISMIGYESIWVVLLPIRLTEAINPQQRKERWIGRTGSVLSIAAFTVAAFVAWFSWTQMVRTQQMHRPYTLPAVYLVVALAAIAVLIGGAFSLGRRRLPKAQRKPPTPPTVFAVTVALALPWFAPVLMSLGLLSAVPAPPSVAWQILWGSVSFVLANRWSSSAVWDERHRVAAVAGALLASMAAGFGLFALGGALLVDWIGKAALDVAAMILLWLLHRRTARVVR